MTKAIKNIFIPVNFSDTSDSAIYAGIAMCKRHHAALHLLHIETEKECLYLYGKKLWLSIGSLEREVTRLNQLEAHAKRIRMESNIECFFHTGKGVFHEVLATKSKDFYGDLIILQKGNSSWFDAIKRHSLSKILKNVGCPVLTIPAGKWSLSFKNIFFPLRPIFPGIKKLEAALPIIQRNKARVSLFAAWNPLKEKTTIRTASMLMQKADNILSRHHITVEKEISSTADVAKEVVRRAVEKDSDLIVISASVKKGFASIFTRSYTEKVIDSSPIPVLSVLVS
jgi:nucleotide-binding universal stress UspA family protein